MGVIFFEGNHQTSSGFFEDFFPFVVFCWGDGMSKLHFWSKGRSYDTGVSPVKGFVEVIHLDGPFFCVALVPGRSGHGLHRWWRGVSWCRRWTHYESVAEQWREPWIGGWFLGWFLKRWLFRFQELGETEIKRMGRIFLVCEEEGATKLKSFAGW